ncbi:MAG: hypothetical protein PHI06_12575 [Desulfobulbaceae bacterium]|nr:hypothetical protein [Desulfobulbaceae bacterium]
MKNIAKLVSAVMVVCGALPGQTSARENSVSGSVSVGPNYTSNVYLSDKNREDEWKSLFAPQLTFSSKGVTDTVALTYAPQYTYNHRREDDETMHNLSFAGDKGFSSRWKVTMTGNYASYDNLFFEPLSGVGWQSQNFVRASAATQAEVVRILAPEELPWDPAMVYSVLSKLQRNYVNSPAVQGQVDTLLTQGAGGQREKYWTSNMGISSVYEFAEKSAITLGYRFSNQDYQTGVTADQVEHAPSILLSYQFNQQWRGEVGYELRQTSYGSINSGTYVVASEDSTTNSPHLQIDFEISPANLLFWNYNYEMISYDGVSSDTTEQGGHVGWKHGFDERTTLTTRIGSSYVCPELGEDERDYTLDLALSRTYDKALIALNAKGLTAEAKTAGSWDKSRRSWEAGSNISYKLQQDLSATGRLSYGQWDSWSYGYDDSSYDRLQFGAGLSYGFMRWFTLSLNYDYNLFDTADLSLEDYSEHLVSIRLAAAKELWRW